MDTDSPYMALSAPLESIFKPGMEREFWEEYGMWFPKRARESHNSEFIDCMLSGGTWVQGECCKHITKHDSRTPGLFKGKYKVIQGLLLSTRRPMSFGTLSSTHRRRVLKEFASAWMYWQQMCTKVYFRLSTLSLWSTEVSSSDSHVYTITSGDNLLLCQKTGPWGWCFYNPTRHHLKVLVPGRVLKSRSQVLGLQCTLGWSPNQTWLLYFYYIRDATRLPGTSLFRHWYS